MSDESGTPENQGAPATPEKTGEAPAPSNAEVLQELHALRELLGEHAEAMAALHAELAKEHDELAKRVEALVDHAALGDQVVAQLRGRLDDALVRLGVEKSAPAPVAPATPATPEEKDGMVFDGTHWVAKPEAAE